MGSNTVFLSGMKKISLAVMLAGLSANVQAIELLSGFGGDAGFGELAMLQNDDGSSNALNLPFNINFFGQAFSSFFVNNNGNISFLSPLSTFTPRAFPVASQPIIAPYWADVDTRTSSPAPLGGNNVYVASPSADTVVVTWNNVGYFPAQNDKQNNFQLVLQKAPGTTDGSFSAEFRYDRLQWTTGSASGGINGLGGVPAQAGYDAGDNINYETLPGSLSNEVLNLVNLSNVSTATPGLWRFLFNNGALPGQTAENAFLPVVVDGAYQFEFNVQLNQRVFIDPLVAVGYDYEVTGNQFTSVLLPLLTADTDGYAIYALGNVTPGGLLGTVMGGTVFDFAAPLSGFTVVGIDTAAMLSPGNTTAFVTGLTFLNAGVVTMSQTPITSFVAQVPEPSSYAMLLCGLAGLIAARRQMRA
ncbi:nidogen-like domain-containing protein [Methylophilus sp. 5]|uniref:nidogen-like domain-containing protein n=1 Tax=Methylophilus sp. 5 TaxID=1112274 RepID=UPI0004B6607D|nr:nidogen-like domain-containing protein [Methylophilus sp. 5]